MFESGAILLYLAEKFGAFIPKDSAGRAECLSWLFRQMGAGPYLGGGFGLFYAYAPIKIEYTIDRFAIEVKRQLDVLDRQLAANEDIAGAEYTIADMAIWPWYGALAKGPAGQRGRRVNRVSGDPASQLRERHDASDFEGPAKTPRSGSRPPTAPAA